MLSKYSVLNIVLHLNVMLKVQVL